MIATVAHLPATPRVVARRTVARVVAVILLAALAGHAEAGDAADVLVIYSPHYEAIEKEFTRAFASHYTKTTGRRVEIKWPDAGGSSGILRQLKDKYRQGIHDVDVVFGGGPIHAQLKAAGLLQRYRLPEALLAKLPKTIAGEPLYDPEFHWYGAAISTFGLIYNKRLVGGAGRSPVTEWMDMARPDFFGLVGAVDAGQSGSVRKAYEIILQAYGYEKGMRLLALMGANARDIGASASTIPRSCSRGFVALGPCIDFFAWRQMLAPGGEHLGFALPAGLTVINTDPISILSDAPHPEAAKAFVRFVMSLQGQKLWSLRAGTPGGPVETTLGRYAVLPEVYRGFGEYLMDGLASPLDAPPNATYDQDKENARIDLLPVYLDKLMIENKRPLTEAWRAVIDAGSPEDLVAELTRPIVTEEEMLRLAREVWAPVRVTDAMSAEERRAAERKEERRKRRRSDLKLQWSERFRAQFDRVREKALSRIRD
jgi:iron(III) transport system substrate-binding protein